MAEEIPWEDIYSSKQMEQLPWYNEYIPKELAGVVNRYIMPCRAADLGCGAGTYAINLAEQGYQVTGIDVSQTAVMHAREKAKEKGVSAVFVVANVLDGLRQYRERFSFAYDWYVLHHIHPKDLFKYITNVKHILTPGGKYFSISFNEMDGELTGKVHKSRLGTIFYLYNEAELAHAYEQAGLKVLELSVRKIGGFASRHINYALLEKER